MVTIYKKCMEPSKTVEKLAAALVWPDPRADGFTLLPPAALRRVQALIAAMINYIQTQRARCEETRADPAR